MIFLDAKKAFNALIMTLHVVHFLKNTSKVKLEMHQPFVLAKRNLPQENYWHVCNLIATKILFFPSYTSIQDYICFLPLYLRGIWNIKEGRYCFLEHTIDSLMNNFRNLVSWGINKSCAKIIPRKKEINRYSIGTKMVIDANVLFHFALWCTVYCLGIQQEDIV